MSTLKSSAEHLTLNADGSGNDIKFQSNATEVAAIDQAGNLTLSGTVDGVDIQTLNTTAGAALPKAGGTMTGGVVIDGASGHLRLQGTTTTAKNVSIQYNESGDYGQINCDQSGVNQKDLWVTGLNLRFGRNTSIERMIIKDDGKVGIGTTSPSHTLHVTGDGRATRLIGSGVIESSSGFLSDTFAVMGVNTSNAATKHGAVFASKHADSNALLVGTHDATFNSFVVKGSGNVGIGLTAPLRALHVKSGAGTAQIQSTASTSTLYFADSGSSSIDNQGVGSASNDITLIAGGYERMRIASSGKVGIGITSPAGMLHVDGHTGSIPSIFESNGNGDSTIIQLKVKANNGSTSTQGLYGAAGSASTDNYITLGNSNSSGVTVNNSGKVGIGTTTPTADLHVQVAEPVVKLINTTTSTTNSTSKRIIYNSASGAQAMINDLLFSWQQVTAVSWIMVRTPQAYADQAAGGWADMKLSWTGYHASNTTMKMWTAAFHNNHGKSFSWSKTGITTVGGGSGSYGPYNYTPDLHFYRQTSSAHGYTNSDAWMRNLFIKISGNSISNVCSQRSLYINGLSGGMEYEVFHMGTTTPGGGLTAV